MNPKEINKTAYAGSQHGDLCDSCRYKFASIGKDGNAHPTMCLVTNQFSVEIVTCCTHFKQRR